MLHEIIFIIALSSEDFLRRLQILVNGPLSRNFRLHFGWLKVKSIEAMQYLTNDLQNYVVAFKKEKW